MPSATLVKAAPLTALSEEALVHVARTLEPAHKPVRPGDTIGDALVVLEVKPEAGAAIHAATEIELAPAPRTRDAAKVEIALLLDVSESMGLPWDKDHTRLTAALASIASFLPRADDAVESVSLYEYAKQAKLAAGPARPRELGALPAPTPKGQSRTADALDAALAGLAARTRPDVSQVILLFTDGVSGVEELMDAAERAGRLHVPIHSIVFAPEVDEVFDRVARESGGSVQQAAHPLTIEFVHQPGG